MCKKTYYRSVFKCAHSYEVLYERQRHGRGCRGRCPDPEEVIDHEVMMTHPCEACQASYAWIYIPDRESRSGWRWVEASVWAAPPEPEPEPEPEPAARRRRRRRRRYRTPSPHPRVFEQQQEQQQQEEEEEEQWEEWRNDEEPYLEEDYDPPPAYRP